jgi:hypothetical protein
MKEEEGEEKTHLGASQKTFPPSSISSERAYEQTTHTRKR